MAESFITQCPHCGTSFRVRNEQLSVANGSVRCGACLQVFSARNHVVTGAASQSKPNPVAKKAKPKPAAKQIKASPEAKAKVLAAKKAAAKKLAVKTLADQKAAKLAAQKAAQSAKSARAAKSSPPVKKNSDFDFKSDDDDDAEFLFQDGDGDDEFQFEDSDDDSLFDEGESKDGFGDLSDSFMSLNQQTSAQSKQVDHFQSESQKLEDEFDTGDDDEDESWAESMLEEIENDDNPAARPAQFQSREITSPRQAQAQAQAQAQRQSQQATSARGILDFDDNPMTSTQSVKKASASSVVNKASRVLDLDFHAEERLSRLRPLGWLFVAILLVTLAGQLAWLQRDTFARMDQWRGLYEAACEQLKCELPEQIDLNAIRTSVLVREHKDPKLSDIRIVDIVLNNKAAFKQAFPVLLLQYTDVNGKLVADQAFQPTDYLKGEMTGVGVMPINTRIYISLPIKTPTRNAVNYQLILTAKAT